MIYIWLTGFVIVLCVFLYRIASPNGRDVFCPFYLVSLLYAIIFVFGPIYYLQNGITRVEGIETLTYIPEATFAFLFGYVLYFAGSVLGSKSLNKHQRNKLKMIDSSLEYDQVEVNYINKYAWIVYFFGLAIGMIYYLITGRSLAMMLSFGQLGERSTLTVSNSYAFLVYFMDLPIGALLLLHTFSQRKFLVWVATGIYATMTITAGFRYLPLCFALAAVVNHYMTKRTRPSILKIVIAVFLVYIFVGVVGIFRTAMKTGGVIDWSLVSSDTISKAFRYNSDVFYPFYCLVHMMNEGLVSCHYGQGVLYIVVYAIPRFLWPSKPTSLGMRAFQAMWGSSLGGAAYPNIGEFYYEFGFFGMLICMFIFGLWIERKFYYTVKQLRQTGDVICGLKYTIIYGYLLQFINRGNFSAWTYDLIFFLLPIWILEIILKNYRKKCLR